MIAASAHVGVQVSDLTPVLLVVVLLGAGTDYGLFLIFRVREEIRRGLDPHDAVAFSLAKVGESITFSGLTVIAALSTVVIATFGLYQGFGPALAIGIAMALLANLTLLPALLAILRQVGVLAPDPRRRAGGTGVLGAGRRPGGRAGPSSPWWSGSASSSGCPCHCSPTRPTGFDSQAVPASSDSARGQALLAAHYPMPPSPTRPTCSSACRRSVWDDPVGAGPRPATGCGRPGSSPRSPGRSTRTAPRSRAAELADAHRQLAGAGPAGDAAGDPTRRRSPGPWPPTTPTRRPAHFISADGRTLLFQTSLAAGPSTSTAAASAMPDVRAAVARVGTAIGATATGVDGYAAVAADVGGLSTDDLLRIIPIVMLVLALLLAIVLRSLVAPLYLVASVGLSYLASLGFAVLVFVLIGGQDGINFVLPFFMFIFIMALGQDYNILVMTRIREEAHHAPIRTAVRTAVEATGTTVTSAGLILAGTFGVLTATGDTQIVEIGVGLAAGILLDTFFVRTLLVPSAASCSAGGTGGRPGCPTSDRDHGSARARARVAGRAPGAAASGRSGPRCEPSTVSGRGQPTQTL